jgi:hypothetical protein
MTDNTTESLTTEINELSNGMIEAKLLADQLTDKLNRLSGLTLTTAGRMVLALSTELTTEQREEIIKREAPMLKAIRELSTSIRLLAKSAVNLGL